MPYKDKEMKSLRQKERRHGKAPGGKTEAPVKSLDTRVGVTPLSPSGVSILPQERIEGIVEILGHRAEKGLFDDSVERWKRAIRYREWELSRCSE